MSLARTVTARASTPSRDGFARVGPSLDLSRARVGRAPRVLSDTSRGRGVAKSSSDDVDAVEYAPVDPRAFLSGSCATYAVMTASAEVLCRFADVHPDVVDGAAHGFSADASAMWMFPLLASLSLAVTQSEKYEFLREVRVMFERGVLPSVAPLGVVGIFALSLGAGVGEEAMFRGFLMPWVDQRLESFGVGGDAAAFGALASTSLVFGALHAITPAYAIWATWASVLFSIEYVRDGLGSAMFTHTLYDFLAFCYVIVSWMPDRTPSEE